MATRMTQAMMRRMARRAGGADLTRLSDQYRQQVEAMSKQYETEFSSYQRNVAEKMAPFEEQMRQYDSVSRPQFESALAEYNRKLEAHRAQIAAIEADPVTERVQREVVGRKWYGKKEYADVTYFDPKPIPKFEEKAPELPKAPVAPEIQEFDNSQFEARRKELGQSMQREVGERRAARMNTVARRSRTLLKGA
jgi:hypothetical protein